MPKTLPEADARSHVIQIEETSSGDLTIASIAHAGACSNADECPYVDLVAVLEAAEKKSLTSGDYKVTGGDHPKFERVAANDDISPGQQDPADVPDVYSIVAPNLPETPKPDPFFPPGVNPPPGYTGT